MPLADERAGSCAWFGDPSPSGDVLYFGISAFWTAYREGDANPRGLLSGTGPARIGRFDLRSRRLLEPLEVAAAGANGGTWDVLAHPNGRLYFSTFFDGPGFVDPATGAVTRIDGAGRGFTELAPGPEGGWIASRYGADEGESGDLVWLGDSGEVRAEHRLPANPGELLAPKTPAWDPVRREFWVTTDTLPEGPHPALVITEEGRLARRVDDPEIQFARFAADGRGWLAAVAGRRLSVFLISPEEVSRSLDLAREVVLADDFGAALDFVQDIQVMADGRAVLTRWSGAIHVVTPEATAVRVDLPAEGGGLYHTAVTVGDQVCASYCRDIRVVCGPLPDVSP